MVNSVTCGDLPIGGSRILNVYNETKYHNRVDTVVTKFTLIIATFLLIYFGDQNTVLLFVEAFVKFL